MRNSLIVLLAAVGLASCGRSDTPVGGVSPDEAAALNNAAEVLDASPDSLGANAEDESAIPADASTNPDGSGMANAAQLGSDQPANSR